MKKILVLLVVSGSLLFGATSANALWIPNPPIKVAKKAIKVRPSAPTPNWPGITGIGPDGEYTGQGIDIDQIPVYCLEDGTCEILDCDEIEIICSDNGDGDNITIIGGNDENGKPTPIIVIKPKPDGKSASLTLFEVPYTWQDDDPPGETGNPPGYPDICYPYWDGTAENMSDWPGGC